MITKEVNTKAITEVYYIISNLEEKYKNKIPTNIINNMVKYMSKDYEYMPDKDLLPESKALLAVLIEKYFGDEEFNKKLKEYNQYYESKSNEIKETKYNSNELFAKPNITKKEDVALVPITKDKWYKKVFSFFKNILK